MAAIRGTSGVLQLDNLANTKTTLAELTSFTLDTTLDTLETSSMGDDARTYTHGLTTFTISGDFILEDGASDDEQYTSIEALGFATGDFTNNDPSAAFDLYPEGGPAGTGKIKISGTCIITGMSITSSFDGIVTASFTAQGTGGLTYAQIA